MQTKARWRLAFSAGCGLAVAAHGAYAAEQPRPQPASYEGPSISDLSALSLEDLANLPVTSAAKRAEPVSEAPTAIYVITHDEIERSGARSVPEMLRLAPNLGVAQSSASKYVITARGLSGSDAAQNFTNKLLVLIDGRTVYTPLYSGVYWDMQDVMPSDIDRIEVISGPGATLWGSNAINGVINIITRKASETQGLVAEAGAGNLEQSASIRYGGHLGDSLAWRVYAKTVFDRDTVTAANTNAHDNWTKPQAGFRVDWKAGAADTVTVQGDAYQGVESHLDQADEQLSGRNVLGRWTHAFHDMGQLQIQAYWDRNGRETQNGGGAFVVDTYDLDLQHSFRLGSRNDVVWGGGLRSQPYKIDGANGVFFDPSRRTLNQGNAFVQDTIHLDGATRLVLGVKLENDPYSGLAVLPSARLSRDFGDKINVWAAASQAIRSPTPFDRDVFEQSGEATVLHGNPEFESEKVTAYEIGAHLQPASRVALSVSAFYNNYYDLKTLEPAPVTLFPITWGNGLGGYTWGVEAWGSYQVAPWWRLGAGFDLFRGHLTFEPGASGFLGTSQAGNEPHHQAQLKSSMSLTKRITWEIDGRWVDSRRNPSLVPYAEVDASIAFAATDHIRLQITGANLVHALHQEFPGADAIPRSIYASLRWSF